jgi:hypothetical protein
MIKMVTTKIKGYHHRFCHESAECIDGKWIPIEPLTYDCPHCGKSTIEDYDPCLGILPGVVSACCGHGYREDSFIRFENGVTIRGFIIEEGKKDETQ